jgi:putative Holliday junction resolvase
MPDPAPRVVVAFDFGLRRIGTASGDTLTRSPVPRSVVTNGPGGPDWNAIQALLRTVGPHQLVVGTPYNADGSASAMTAPARRFAAELARRFGLPVDSIDERYSSLEAEEALKALRASGTRQRRVRREDVDSGAAAVILQRWFNGETGSDPIKT